MPKHIDRGMLVVHDEPDGTTSLSICASVVDGKPTGVYAQYHHARSVHIDRDVTLAGAGGTRYTNEIVEVSSLPGGGVMVRRPAYDIPS